MSVPVKLKDINFPHFTVPSLNCSIENDVKNYVTEYYGLPYHFSLPTPFGDPGVLNEKHLCGFDRITKLVNTKKMWEITRDDIIRQSLKFKGNYVVKTKFKNVKKVFHGTLELAKHLMADPDPKFSGFYNWYYSGGCINTLFHSNKHFLVYSNCAVPGACVITPLEIENSECVPEIENCVVLRTSCKEPIFQICVNNDFIAVRQKNVTNLFTLINDEEFKFKKIHSNCETKESIVSTSIRDDLDGEYCTLTTSHMLKIWTPEMKNECITHAKIDWLCRNCDHWGCVKYLTNNNILVSTRSCVYLKDTRVELYKNAQKWKTNISDCSNDVISLLLRDRSINTHAFVGTTHYLYEIDFRMGLSKQWTHMMEFPPMYGVVVPTDTSNSILIGSQSMNELIFIDSSLQVYPYVLPAPKETLTQANSQGLCLDPVVSSRFHFSMVGFTAFADNVDNKMFVFRNNSLGDIFYQNIIHKEETTIDYASECNIEADLLSEWETKCLQSFDALESESINVTDIKNCSSVFNKIIKNGHEKPLDVSKTVKRKCSKLKFPKFKLTNNLSQSLLGVWDIDDLNILQQNDYVTEDRFAKDTDNRDVPSSSNSAPLTESQLDVVIENIDDSYETSSNVVTSTNRDTNMFIINESNDVYNDALSTNNFSSFMNTPSKTQSQIKKKNSRVSSGF